MKKQLFKNILPVIFQVGILLLAITLPIFKFDFDVSTILTVVSLLFTILIGFFIAAATSNYLRLQTIISNEDASLISIFDLVKIIQPSAEKKFKDLIDRYMIAALDYDLLDYFEATSTESSNLLIAIDKITASDQQAISLLPNLQDAKNNIASIRQEASVLIKRTVTPQHWIILITLATIISIILLGIRVDSAIASLLIGSIIVALYQTLNLLYKIDSNEFLADRLAYEAPQKVFLAIGQAKYYPEHVINEKLKKSLENENYRVGIYKNFPATMEKDLKLVPAIH